MQSQTGSYVLTSLITPPASSDLTTLENAKVELDINSTEDDAWLTRAIPQQSARIARHCNRIFGLATWQDQFRPQRGVWGEGVRGANNPIELRRWPLVSIVSIVETVAGVATTLVEGTDYEVEIPTSMPGDEGAALVYRLNENGNPRTWPAALIVIQYQAGYFLPNDETPNLPPDIEEATLRLLTMRYAAWGRDPTLRSREQPGVGTETWWVGGPPMSGALPQEIASMIDAYRVPVIG